MRRWALVEDTATKAKFLARVFRESGDYELIGHAETISQAQTIPALKPTLVLVDRMLPDGDGLALADDLAQQIPDARVYLYSSSDPPPLLPANVGYLRDSEAMHWPTTLRPGHEVDGILVRHPKPTRS